MKVNKRKKGSIILVLILTSFIFSLTLIPPGSDGKNSEALSLDEKVKTSAANRTDEISTVFTWKSTSTNLNDNSDESLSLNSFVANLTDFDPINSTSYTNLQTINTTFQPSNASWNHFRDFNDDVPLPSTNALDMLNPYDTTIFFAREGAIYNITASWEGYILSFGNLETNLFLFNQSQFHNFENYIMPWRTPISSTVAGFKSDHDKDDWLVEYSNSISNGIIPQTMNASIDFTTTVNKTGWHYLVMWGPGSTESPKVSTQGDLISEGLANANITVSDLMDMYRPSLGKVNGFIDKPERVYERVVQGYDEIYGNSLALVYIYEYSDRKLKEAFAFKPDNDWVPFIAYIAVDAVGKFPNRVVCYFDDSWADDKDRYLKIIDPNAILSDGTYNFKTNITAEFTPFLNATVRMNATISTTPVSMENRLGAALRLATTTNSHGFEIKPYNSLTGTTFNWTEVPRTSLDNSVLKKLYNDTTIEFLNAGWQIWADLGGKYYPEKTPFTLYLNSLFAAPYLVSGLENVLLVAPKTKNWLSKINPSNLFFNSSLDIEVNTTVSIPINFTVTYPQSEPIVGEFCDFTLELGAMGNPNITIDYKFNYSMDLNMLLNNGNYSISKEDSINFIIPLKEIDYFLAFFGVEDGLSGLASQKIQEQIDQSLSQSQVDKYISIENFTLGSHVVGNLVSCDITFHLWPMIKYLVNTYKPDLAIACDLIDMFILNETLGLDLILSPQLQGVVNGTMVGDGLEFDNGGVFEFNDTQTSLTFQAERTQDFSSTDIQLQSLMYFLNFHTDWAFEVNFNEIPHAFGIEDLRWELGTYPNIDFAQNPMGNSDNLTLSWTESTLPPQSPTLSITTPSPTTSLVIALEWTTSVGADNYTLYRHTESITSGNINSATDVKTITGTDTLDTVPGIGRWYYAVIAINKTGSSEPSNSPYIDVKEVSGPPNAPILTITTPSPTTSLVIALEWTTSVGADNYSLYRYTSPITSSNLHLTTHLKTITETTTTDTVPGIGRWYYAVVATNESGSSDPSNYDYIDVQEETTPEEPGGIPGYPLSFIGIACATMILISYKKMQHLKKKS